MQIQYVLRGLQYWNEISKILKLWRRLERRQIVQLRCILQELFAWRCHVILLCPYSCSRCCVPDDVVTDRERRWRLWQQHAWDQWQCAVTLSCIFTARCTLVQSAVLRSHVVCLSERLSVCLSVTLVNCDHIGWNSSKIISPLVSLGRSLFATPTWRVCSKWNTPKFSPE